MTRLSPRCRVSRENTCAERRSLGTGDTVVVLEAMKMQSNYKVSSACVVKDILVSEGDSVDNNQVLMT